MWQVVKPLQPHPLAVGQARSFCVRRLTSVLAGRGEFSKLIADAASITGELVTNAVTAGSSMIELVIGLTDNAVRIAVTDDAAGTVEPATPSPTDTSGRGLMIIAALARDWGVTSEDGTKHVWAELELVPTEDDVPQQDLSQT